MIFKVKKIKFSKTYLIVPRPLPRSGMAFAGSKKATPKGVGGWKKRFP